MRGAGVTVYVYKIVKIYLARMPPAIEKSAASSICMPYSREFHTWLRKHVVEHGSLKLC